MKRRTAPWKAIAAITCLMVIATPHAAVAEEDEAGEKLCDIADRGLDHLSGLAASGDGYYAITDGTYNQEQIDVLQLDASCNTVGTVTAWINPADPEDLAVDAQGVFWIADTGNDDGDRTTIALHQVTADASIANTYRFAFPDGVVQDTEAMLLQPDGTPIFATKTAGEAQLLKPAGSLDQALDPDNPLPLENIGTVTLEATETSGGPEELGDEASQMITGGAVTAEGDKAVLRTYTDAYEWDVEDGDVGAALTGDTEPRVTPLPDEPRGEAITYNADGKFVTGSEGVLDEAGNLTTGPQLWTYEPATKSEEGTDDGKSGEEEAPAGPGFLDMVLDTLGINGILWVIAGLGVIGAVIFFFGLRAIIRARRSASAERALGEDDLSADDRHRRDDDYGRDDHRHGDYGGDGYDRDDDYHHDRYPPDGGPRDDQRLFAEPDDPYSREPRSGTVYGGDDPRRGEEPGTGTVYGGGRPY